MLVEFLHRDGFIAKSNRFAGGTSRANRSQTRHREVSPFQHTQQFLTDRASRANNGDVIIFHVQPEFIAGANRCKLREPSISRSVISSLRWRKTRRPFAVILFQLPGSES